jgi:hypothetical protein
MIWHAEARAVSQDGEGLMFPAARKRR